MSSQPLDWDTIEELAEPTLEQMQAEEVVEAVKWLKTNVLSSHDLTVQEILFKSWLSIYGRNQYDMMFD